jgi:hypothetical protein
MTVKLGFLGTTLLLTAGATGGIFPAGLVFLANLTQTAALILLFCRFPLGGSFGWVIVLGAVAGWASSSLTGGAIYSMLTLWPAALIGWAAARRFSYGKLFLIAVFAALLPLALFIPLAYPSVKLQLLAAGETMGQQMRLWGLGLGYTPVRLEETEKTFKAYMDFIVGVVPALYYMSNVVFILLAHFFSLWVLGRRGILLPGPKNFLVWQAPFLFTFFLGAGLAGHLFLESAWLLAADNILLLVVFAYAVCGASNLEYFFKKMSAHWAIKGLFYIWLAVFGLVSFFILSAVGFFDSRFDFRRLRQSAEAQGRESEE